MSRRSRYASLALLTLVLVSSAGFAASPSAPVEPLLATPADDGPVRPEVLSQLLSPEPIDLVTPPKYGPCTMSFQCFSECGNRFISCSGQEICRMDYGPSYPWCHQNIYVQCDDQPPIYCIGGLDPG